MGIHVVVNGQGFEMHHRVTNTVSHFEVILKFSDVSESTQQNRRRD